MPDTIRVLVNYFTSQPDRVTGISTYAFQIMQALARRPALRLALLTNWTRTALPASIQDAGFDILHERTPRSEKFQIPHTAYRAARAARRLKADVIFTPHPFGALTGGKARVLVVHDLYRETHPQFFRWDRRLTWKAGFSLAVTHSTRVICVSDATRADFSRFYPGAAGKAVTVREAAAVKLAAGEGAIPDKPYVLAVANATPNKNMERLIEALVLLRRQGIAPRVVWVGRDDYGGVTAALARHPSLDHFIRLGSVDAERLNALYANADAYINTSLVEGFCIPILEAQTFGVPVLCSDIPVLREVAGDGAITFDPYNETAIAAALRRIWTEPMLRQTLGQRGRANAANFSWDKAAAETEQVFAPACPPARAWSRNGGRDIRR